MKNFRLAVALFFVLFILFSLELFSGPANLMPSLLVDCLYGRSSVESVILLKLRLPRALYAICIGIGLSCSGLALQGLFRNPLADPYTLGISGGSALGAVLVGTFGQQWGNYSLPLAAFTGALLSCTLVYLVAFPLRLSKSALILSGVMIGYLFQSGLMAAIYLADNDQAHNVMVWLMGDISSASHSLLFPTGCLTVVGCVVLFQASQNLNRLSLGEEKAISLGVNVQSLRRQIFIGSSVVTGACVASVGMVGFVGLMVPHIARAMVGPDHKRLFPFCALIGASFVLLCDWLARRFTSPIELPLGVITGLFGSLAFLSIFIRRLNRPWE